MLTPNQNSYTKNSKVDDEDGHYIVVPDADLTERCELKLETCQDIANDIKYRLSNKASRPGHLW